MSDELPVDETEDSALVPPGEDAEGRIRVDNPVVEEEPEEEPITTLTPKERQQFASLLTIGKRTKTVELFDHSIVLASLNVDDEMLVGEAVRDYQGTQGFARSYQAATVAAAIRSVNGESWDTALQPDAEPSALFHRKFTKVRKMYPLVVQSLYQECLKMDAEFAELVNKLGKL